VGKSNFRQLSDLALTKKLLIPAAHNALPDGGFLALGVSNWSLAAIGGGVSISMQRKPTRGKM